MRQTGGEMEPEFQTEMKSTICPWTKSVHNGAAVPFVTYRSNSL